MAQKITPMRKQYLEMKEKCPDCLLFFRLGDFYEMFDEDARIASKVLDLTLTTRDRNKDIPQEEKLPMCGVPYHSYQSYLARLVAKGYKVAICEQTAESSRCHRHRGAGHHPHRHPRHGSGCLHAGGEPEQLHRRHLPGGGAVRCVLLRSVHR